MLITNNFEAHARKLLSPEHSATQKQQLVTEIRDSIEIVHTSEYGNFLRHLFPAFYRLLSEGQPQFTEGPEQKIRNMLLEVLNRLPNNETLRPHVQNMLSLCMKLLEIDNEENAVICLRIIFDLHKNFRPTLEREVKPFLEFVERVYRGLPKTVTLLFSESRSDGSAGDKGNLGSATREVLAARAEQAQARAQTAQTRAQQLAQAVAQAQAQAQARSQQAAQLQALSQAQPTSHNQAQAAQAAQAAQQAAQHVQALNAQSQQAAATCKQLQQIVAATTAVAAAAPKVGDAAGTAGGAPADASAAPSASSGSLVGSGSSGRGSSSGVLTRSTESFKVLTECPLIVMLLFQLYPRYIQTTIPQLIPLMVQTLGLQTPKRAIQRHRQATTDFMAAQVKTLSFLTYLLRAFADFMRSYQESIPKCVINLLLTCPPESVSIRKDILVATRHILATDFRVGFFSQIDTLLDENVLLGAGPTMLRSSHEALRPLACSTLADLVHHVRGELGIKHLSRVVHIFSCHIHDVSLPLAIQITSVRLLLNLVESIFHKNDVEARALLVRILHTLVSKFATLKVQIPHLLSAKEEAAAAKANQKSKVASASPPVANASAAVPSAALSTEADVPQIPNVPQTGAPSSSTSGTSALPFAQPDAAGAHGGSSRGTMKLSAASRLDPFGSETKAPADATREFKQLLKTMILGVKTVVWSVSNSRMQPHPMAGSPMLKGMSEDECLLVARLVKNGLPCFALYSHATDASPTEEKEVLDYFAGVFTVLDSRNFSHVFKLQMPNLYERVLANSAMSTLLQHFLANSNVSRYFAEILLAFLVERLDDFGTADEVQAATLLRLFKLVFGSITLFPDNEPVLRPHLAAIVSQCMRYAASSKQSMHYYSLLRALFKSIGGGKFETLYKEFLPLLPSLLPSLIRAHSRVSSKAQADLLLELCLTLPARLSALLPFLHDLMGPLLKAMQAGPEQVALALRTLEFWIDHLHPEFLQPRMQPHMRELMIALTKQLRPQPYALGPTALRILGKLGGRNRSDLHLHEPFSLREAKPARILLDITSSLASVGTAGGSIAPRSMAPATTAADASCTRVLSLPLDEAIARAISLIYNGPPSGARAGATQHAMDFLTVLLSRLVSPSAPQLTPKDDPEVVAATAAAEEVLPPAPTVAARTPATVKTEVAAPMDVDDGAAAAFVETMFADPIPSTDTAAPSDGAQIDISPDHSATAHDKLAGGNAISPEASEYVVRLTFSSSTTPGASLSSHHDWDESVLCDIVTGIYAAAARPELRDQAFTILTKLTKLTAILLLHTPAPLAPSEPPRPGRTGVAAAAAAAAAAIEPAPSSEGNGSGEGARSPPAHARPRVFLNAMVNALRGCVTSSGIVDGLSGDSSEIVEAGAAMLCILLDSIDALSTSGGAAAARIVDAVHSHLLCELCHLSYGCAKQRPPCGALQVKLIIDRRDAAWLTPRLLDLCTSMLALCADESMDGHPDTRAAANELLLALIRKCLASRVPTLPPPIPASAVAPVRTSAQSPGTPSAGSCGGATPATPSAGASAPSVDALTIALIKRLALEMASSDAGVRDAAKAGLGEMARLAGRPVAALLVPVREAVISPLLAGSLQSLPMPTQVATLEALTFHIQEQASAVAKPRIADTVLAASTKAESALAATTTGTGIAALAKSAASPASVSTVDGAASALAAVPTTAAPSSAMAVVGTDLTVSASAGVASSSGESLPPDSLLPLSKALLAVVRGALRIAEADEFPKEAQVTAGLGGAASATQSVSLSTPETTLRGRMLGRHVRGVPIGVRLRVVAIELLSAMLTYEALKSPPHLELRNQMISCFFKSLTVRSEEVVAVAREALAAVIAQSKLQKELLQSSLRPILLNLADYRKLSVPLLEGLSRLLSLLSNFFNLTLGEKLLEHLRRWNDPEAIAKAKAFKPGDEVKIPCAILSLFHLLPPAPDKFLNELIAVTTTLEAQLPGSTALGRHWSPHREALVPYLRRHAKETIAYFFERIGGSDASKEGREKSTRAFRMLLSIVKHPPAVEVRDELARQWDALLTRTLRAGASASDRSIGAQLRFQGIQLIRAMSKQKPEWLPSHHEVLSELIGVWTSAERKERLMSEKQAAMPLDQVRESKVLVKCFVTCCRHQAEVLGDAIGDAHIQLLFLMLSIFAEHTLVNYDFLKTFYLDEVATGYSVAQRVVCIRYFLRFFQAPRTANEERVQALQLIVLPMLSVSFHKGEGQAVLSKEVIATIIHRLLGGDMLQTYDEPLRIELLRLATLLIEHASEMLVDHRKELIKFSWNHLKSEDAQSKQCAYVNVCRFIQVYETPPKIILQVYVALLRTFQPDARNLVKRALDILTPALPTRLPAGDHKYPTWIKWTKKIVVEEGHSLPQLIHIWQLVARHQDLFFSSSAQFVAQMVNSLNRIGLSPNCSAENRKLAIDLAALIISWELKRIEISKVARAARTSGGGASAPATLSAAAGSKRPAADSLSGCAPATAAATGSEGPPPAKLQKTGSSQAVPEGVPTSAAPIAVAAKQDAPSSAPPSPPSGETSADAVRGASAQVIAGNPVLATATAATPALAAAACSVPSAAPTGASVAAPAAAALVRAGGGPGSATPEVKPPPAEDEFRPSAAIVEVLVNFLIRVALLAAEGKDGPELSGRCVSLLDSALSVWPDATIKFNFLDRQFGASAAPAAAPSAAAATTSDGSAAIFTGLAVLETITKRQPGFLLRQLKAVHGLLTPAFEAHIENPKMVTALETFLSSGLPALTGLASRGPTGAQSEVKHFLDWLADLCGNGLGSRDPQPAREINVVRAHGSLRLLVEVMKASPTLLVKHHTLLTKVLARLTKEFLTRRDVPPTAPPTSGPSNDELLLPALKLTVSLGAQRLPDHGEARKAFLLSLEKLIERATDVDLLLLLLRTVGKWIVAPAGPPPALAPKERASMFLKLSAVESAPSAELHALLLGIAHRILADESLPGRELLVSSNAVKMETPLFLGMRSRSAATRRTFSNHIWNAIGRTFSRRVAYVVASHDSESTPGVGSLWLRSASQVLLSAADPDLPIVFTGAALALPPMMVSTANSEHAGPTASTIVRLSGEAAAALASDVSQFLDDCASQLSLGQLLSPLAELLHDPTAGQLAYEVWVALFPQSWAHLTTDEQLANYKPLLATLQRSSNLKHAQQSPNAVQGWLAALAACSSTPRLPAALLRHLASRFGAWHLALPLLEAGVALHPTETQWYDALADVHAALGDVDSRAAVWQQRALHDETRRALNLERYGAWQAAQDAYAECMTRWQSGDLSLVNTPQAELSLWEEGIVSSAKSLNQWELLSEYAKAWPGSQPALLMECAWKSADWERLRDLFLKANLKSQASFKMLQTYAAIHDGKLVEAEARCNEGIQHALAQWCSLPPPSLASHTPLLQMFQQFQELQESAQMLMELNNAQRSNQLPDLASILVTWRERLPNYWESLPAWNDLVSWRNHMFSHINNVLGRLATPDNPALATKGYQELLWTVVRFAHVARRQQLPQACISIIAKVQTVTAGLSSSDLDDAFSKLREQARACLQLPNHLKQGLQALLAADVTQMAAPQRAELFVVKGELLIALAEASKSGSPSPAEEEAISTAFATAVATNPDLPRGWLLWGSTYDRTFRNLSASKGAASLEVNTAASVAPSSSLAKSAQLAAAAERALTCYLLSLQFSAAKGASIVPRVLTLLDAVAGPVAARALGDNADGIPLWLWIPYIPQLLRGMRKGWGPQAQHLLSRIASAYPQPLHYPLRAYIASSGVGSASPPDLWKPPPLHKPEAAAPSVGAAATASATPASAGPPPLASNPTLTSSVIRQESGAGAAPTPIGAKSEAPGSAVRAGVPAAASPSPAKHAGDPDTPSLPQTSFEGKGVASRILSVLRAEHPRLSAQLDALCDALEGSLLPTLTERLLAAIHDVMSLALNVTPSPPDSIPTPVLDSLKALDRHFGFSSGAAARASSADARALAAGWGLTLRDCVSAPISSLSELLVRLDTIRSGLAAELASRPKTAHLESSCWRLLLSQQPLVEIPGQYASVDTEPAPEMHQLLDRIEATAALTRDPATGETQRRLTLVSDSLCRHAFHLRAPSPLRPHDALGVERLGQLVRLINRRLMRARETRRRGLTLLLPLALRLGRGVMLCASDCSAVSLAAVAHSVRVDASQQPHSTALAHQRVLSQGSVPLNDEARRERLRQAFADACRVVPDDMLVRAIREAVPSAIQQWELIRGLCAQLGLHALLCHTLGLRALQPSSLVFSLSQGALALGTFDSPALPPPQGTPAVVPPSFRLTRNLQRLATPFGVDGAFSASFSAGAECLAHPRKCPIELWLTALAAPEEDGASGAHIRFLPPWSAPPSLAAARARELAPSELVKKMGKDADVHASLRALVAEATSEETLTRQPPAWQAWL